MAQWTLQKCVCEGGYIYCWTCAKAKHAERCAHDEICPHCHGTDKVAVKVEGFDAMLAGLTNAYTYPTKRAAEFDAQR